MKYVLFVLALLVFPTVAEADLLQGLLDLKRYKGFDEKSFVSVDTRQLSCADVRKVVSKQLLITTRRGLIVTDDPLLCSSIKGKHFDRFFAKGAYIKSVNGRCNVWSCKGRLDLNSD